MNDLLKISNLTRTYGKKKVLDGLDLTIGTGKIVGLLAPNGEGKTTLFRLLMGLLTKNDGEILIDGLEPSEVTNSYVSFLPDHYVLGGFHSIRGAMKHMKKYFPGTSFGRYPNLGHAGLVLLKPELFAKKIKSLE